MREEHGAYWFVVECLAAGPQSVWEWKVYVNPGGRVGALDRSNPRGLVALRLAASL